jgi:hypothetical protein
MKEELKRYLKENLIKEKKSISIFKKKTIDNNFLCEDMCMAKCESTFFGSSIDNYIKDNKELNDFQTLLFKYIDDRNLKDSDVYNKVHIDRRLFSKIRSDINYHPKKETVIQLGLALELNTNELEELLSSAEYSLPKNNEFDLIIRFCFDEHIYNVLDVNNLLEDYNCKLLIKE